MAGYGGSILTNGGLILQGKVQAGAPLVFTKIEIGDGTPAAGVQYKDLTSLVNRVKILPITLIKPNGPGEALVRTILTSEGVTAGFYAREIGLYAKDPANGTEVLYCYANAGDKADYIPPSSGTDLVSEVINVVTLVGSASNVSATIDGSLVYATAAQHNSLQNQVIVLDSLTPKRTTANMTLYVSTTGNDANDGLTSGTALRTIAAAVAKIPQIVLHSVIIYIANGSYLENVVIWAKHGNGTISLIGNATSPASVTFSYLELNSCTANVAIQGIQLNNSTGKGCCFLNYNSVSDMNKCRLIGNNRSYNGFNGDRASQIISESYISGMQDAIAARWNSNVHLVEVSGADNYFGITATHNAKVGIHGSAIPAVNQFNAEWGGSIDWGNLTVTRSDMTFYVNPATGDDANDGTSGSPLKTIMAAVRRIPQIVNHRVVIVLVQGSYAAEEVVFSGFYGRGQLELLGSDTAANSVNFVIGGVNVIKCGIYVYVRGVKADRINWPGFYVNTCSDVFIDMCKCTTATFGTTNHEGVRFVRANGSVGVGEFSNRGSGILANSGSIVFSNGNTGTGNGNGLSSAEGSTIGKYQSQPGGVTAENAYAGGVIR
ncbi:MULTISPECIES: phage tail-collar fiber domain-containing protein [Paenibacillus]|uniref:phage tail-collar fiber domain-containing protein n=1 Tax=Paenibacillus TaxID=44249 RepID=UPI0022B9339B|nr:phage tail protein [Paenibacillus caseinilyticus]MCZ8520116.1 phage tail protein [Paenibacillus caseinilyticus]